MMPTTSPLFDPVLTAFAACPTPVIATDCQGRVRLWNRAATELLGQQEVRCWASHCRRLPKHSARNSISTVQLICRTSALMTFSSIGRTRPAIQSGSAFGSLHGLDPRWFAVEHSSC